MKGRAAALDRIRPQRAYGKQLPSLKSRSSQNFGYEEFKRQADQSLFARRCLIPLTAALGDLLCSRVANGETLDAICDEAEMPPFSLVDEWLHSPDEVYRPFQERFERSIQTSLRRLEWRLRSASKGSGRRTNAIEVAGAKLEIDTARAILKAYFRTADSPLRRVSTMMRFTAATAAIAGIFAAGELHWPPQPRRPRWEVRLPIRRSTN